MIIVLLPSEPSPDERAAEVFSSFADVVHSRVPFGHAIDLHVDALRERGICADCEKRVVPTRQGLCPFCAGYLHDAAHIEKMRAMAQRLNA